MPTFSSDGVDIYYQIAGEGYPMVLSHEFAGDITSWEPQVNFFSRRYRVITYAAEVIRLRQSACFVSESEFRKAKTTLR